MTKTLVTGGAKGLGAHLSLALAKNGNPLIIHYNTSLDSALALQEECRKYTPDIEIIQGDFSSPDLVNDFIRRLKSDFPDVKNLVNNVGNYLIKSALKTETKEWIDLFQTNLHAPFALCRNLSDSLIKNSGSIINIGVAGIPGLRADIYSPAYSIGKSALYGLTKSLAKELIQHNVTVNMVSPGYLENSVDLPGDPMKLLMERSAKYSEVSDMILYLLSEKGRYITGQNIEISGGVRL